MFPVVNWLSRYLVDLVGRSLDDWALVVWLMVSRLCANDIRLDLSVPLLHTVPTANTNTSENTNTNANANLNGIQTKYKYKYWHRYDCAATSHKLWHTVPTANVSQPPPAVSTVCSQCVICICICICVCVCNCNCIWIWVCAHITQCPLPATSCCVHCVQPVCDP